MVIRSLNVVDEEHLQEVMQYAKNVGSVSINVYYDGEAYYALEGSHRLESAARCGLSVTLNKLDLDAVISFDIEDLGEHLYHKYDLEELPQTCTVLDLVEYVNHTGKVYTEEDFKEVIVK